MARSEGSSSPERSDKSNGFTPVNMPMRMPSPKSKAAPKFDGRNLQEFLGDFEMSAKAAILSNGEKAGIILNYCSKKVRRTLEDLEEFKRRDWQRMMERMKRLYSSADHKYEPSLSAFRKFVKRKRTIKKRAHLDKYTADFMRKSNRLVEMARLTKAERDRNYYLGLPSALKEKIRSRVHERAKRDKGPEDVFTRANPPPMDMVIEEAEKEFQVDAFDAPSDSEASESEYDSSDESEMESEGESDDEKISKLKRIRGKKAKGESAIEKEKDKVEETKGEKDEVEELAKMIKDLTIQVAAMRKDKLEMKTDDVRTYRCFMCDGNITHAGGFRRCPETTKLLTEKLVTYSKDGRLVLMDGTDLPRLSPGQGGVATAVRNLKVKEGEKKTAKTMCVDLYLEDEPALTGDAYAISCEDFEYAAADRTKKISKEAREEGMRTRSGARLKYTHSEVPKFADLTRTRNRVDVEKIGESSNKRARVDEAPDEGERPKDTTPEIEEIRAPAQQNTRPAWKERMKQNKEVREDVVMAENRDKGKEVVKGPVGFKYTSDLRQTLPMSDIANRILEAEVTIPLKMVLAGSNELQKEIFAKAKMRREYNKVAEANYAMESDSDDDEYQKRLEGAESLLSLKERVEKYSYLVASGQPRFYAVGTGKVEGRINGREALFLIDCGSELNIMPVKTQQELGLPIDPDGTNWSLSGIGGQKVSLLGCCRSVNLEIGGRRFDHHIFVSDMESRYDAILGQPWLTWVSASITYAGQDGSMSITAHVNGDPKGQRVIIPAIRTSMRNQTGLSMSAELEVSANVSEYSYRKAGSDARPSWHSGLAIDEVPGLGGKLEFLCGANKRIYSAEEKRRAKEIGESVGEEFDGLLRRVDRTVNRLPSNRGTFRTCEWTERVLGERNTTEVRKYWVEKAKYKPVKDRVHPVQARSEDANVDEYRPIEEGELPELPVIPPRLREYGCKGRLDRERLGFLLDQCAEKFLTKEETRLLAYVLVANEEAIAFNDAERGTFSREYYPDYKIPTVPHIPWCEAPYHLPKVEEQTIMRLLEEQEAAGKYEPSTAAYRSNVFTVMKKNGSARLVHDMRPLNRVTIRDAALPPRVEDFAESFVGRQIYLVADLFSGYDARILEVNSRELTTFHTPRGLAKRLTRIPQGYTNAQQVFQRSTLHALGKEVPENADIFVDDCGIKGPRERYGDEPIDGNPEIRKFVYEFLTTVNRILTRFRLAGITISGYKLVPATPVIKIVGAVCSANGWHLEHGLITKILNWPTCESATEVRGFLGTAGVGRKWIKNFSLVVKPLTQLTKKMEEPFEWTEEADFAMNRIKKLVTEAPVLKVLDYEAAKREFEDVRDGNEHGLVVVAVDSSIYGAGWVLYQYLEGGKHPILFGSCTFSDPVTRYSQPKVELYGCFRAIAALKHRIWGIRFRLEMDAKFVKEMLEKPDLPNAPMTRWISYLKLFDFEVKHIPAERHRVADGLSRRRPSEEDSDDSDASMELERYVGEVEMDIEMGEIEEEEDEDVGRTVDECIEVERGLSEKCSYLSMANDWRTKCINEQWISGVCKAKRGVGSLYTFSEYNPVDPEPLFYRHEHGNETAKELKELMTCDWENARPVEPYLRDSLLRSTDFPGFIGMDFYWRKIGKEGSFECKLGDELIELTGTEYRHAYRVAPCSAVKREDVIGECGCAGLYPGEYEGWRKPGVYRESGAKIYEPDILPTSFCYITEKTVEEANVWDGARYWDALREYLKGNGIGGVFADTKEITKRKFMRRAERFFVKEERIYRRNGGNTPQLVIEDVDDRKEYLENAHDMTGHRGVNPTFKRIWDCAWWPGVWTDAEWYVQSCFRCQIRSKYRPMAPLNPRASIAVFRKVFLDTKVMPKGRGGYGYILHAQEDLASWPEAKAVKNNTSEAWATFVYEDIICRFGQQMIFVCDNGPEFKGMVAKIFEKYKIPCILVSPYHPQANAVVERTHQTLVNSLLKICHGREGLWPEYVHAALLAMRVTANRQTGLTPYFLLYGQNPVFPWNIEDPIWQRVEWDRVDDRESLIALRAIQIACKEEDVGDAAEEMLGGRTKSARKLMIRHLRNLGTQEFEEGMWVLRHETWLDNQMGNKERPMWSGPYVVVRRTESGSYYVEELDGTAIRDPIAAVRLKPFWYRKGVPVELWERERRIRHNGLISLERRSVQDSFVFSDFECDDPKIQDFESSYDVPLLIDTIGGKYEVEVESNLRDLLNWRSYSLPWW